ncbi:MAG TPA: MFS transporter [Thermoanaerobaculia bacterium]|jgi:MFS family permease
MRAPRGVAAFLVICGGQMVSLFGTGLTAFALGVWIYQRTGSVTQYSTILLFNVLPPVLLSPVAGALVDRFDRRRVIIASDCAAGLATLTLALLFFSGRLAIWHIYVALSVSSSAQAFRWPALSASMTLLVPGRQLGRASGLMQMGVATAQVLAPLAAGALLGPLGMAGVLGIDFTTFLFAVLTLLTVRIPRPAAAAAPGEVRSLGGELAYGWHYLRRHPGLLALLCLFAGSNFTMGLLTVLITPLVLSFASPRVLGTVLSVAGSGLLLGGIVMAVWGGPRRRLAGISCALLAQSLVLLLGGWRISAPQVAAMAFVFLGCYSVINTCSQALWQSKVAAAVQGRVFATRQMVALSALPLSRIVAGPLADRVFEPLLAPGGRLAGTLGRILGTGPGRGIELLIIVLGLFNLLVLALAWSYPRLRLLEDEMPDLTTAREAPLPA